MNNKIFVSIATYNEKENIEKLIREIFNLGVENLSIIIIDDNSPDGTARIVENLQKEFQNLHLISRSGKLGYGSAHIAGFKKARENSAEIIISMDADFSHNPRVIPELIRAIEEGNDVAIGSRRVRGGEVIGWSLWRKFASAGAMMASQIILGIKTRDLTSGYRAYKREVFDKINLDLIKSDGYSFLEELIYLVEKNGFKIKEVPIIFYDRRLGHSKLSRKEIVKFFITIFRIKFSKKLKMSTSGGSAFGGKLLMITRKVDKNDALAGFTYNWVKKIGEDLAELYVITWQKSDRGELPENIKIISLPENKIGKIFVLLKLVGNFLSQVDGIFCHMNPEYTILAAIRAKYFCQKKNRKKIISWYTHKAVTWRRRCMEFCADIILTASVESFRHPRYPQKVKVVGHGIDLELFKPADKNNSGRFNILSVGRISPTKDYESIIKAVDILNDVNINFKIVGDVILKSQREYFENLYKIVETMNLIGRVEFVGWVANQDVALYYQQADLFINMSGTGSLDKAVLEAMACGCLVLTANEAFAKILPPPLMVEKNNPQVLAEKIQWVMSLPQEEKNETANKLINEIRNNHNLDNLVKKIISQFHEK
ncbi:glycosyltransferase [Candidatus Falkowbacteria bacterium]|nr:glycosyltransferase [Candidatus Falkowbacteria bacterium]